MDPGNTSGRDSAPYLRTETLEYTERTTETIILGGWFKVPFGEVEVADLLTFTDPEIDWTVSSSTADLYQPDKRQFGALWKGPSFNPGFPPFIPPFTVPAEWQQYKPDANFTLGNFQRIWKEIGEESEQISLNVKFPFSQWSGRQGYLKVGAFDDELVRSFDQNTYSNFADPSDYNNDFENPWSGVFQFEDHPVTDGPPRVDVDYRGDQHIAAWYWMVDMPVTDFANVIGGLRFESTDLSIVNFPEENALWYPPDAIAGALLSPGDADVDFTQDDMLPSLGLILTPLETVTIRTTYTETIARQTFKELTPILQQEYLGADIFIGNPELRPASLVNYDLRVDWTPYEGGLISASWFKKKITDTIEYVQRVGNFTFTTPENFPVGRLSGLELEVRQNLGAFWEDLSGLTLGGNATFINATVTLPEDEAAIFEGPAILAPQPKRDMTAAPDHLYNLFLTYDLHATGTQFSLFYTMTGDTLVAGAGESDGNFVPDVYALGYDSLNLTVTQRLGQYFKLRIGAKNLTDPEIEQVYRSRYISGDVRKTSHTKGIDFFLGISAEFTF